MAKATFHFPRGFLLGTATAAHQVEGNNTNNNWWAWEQKPGHILQGHKSGRACDWWAGRWRDDFDRAADGNQNAHRLSVEWSRIQPAPDRWNEDALDRYIEMLRGLQERGLTPLVTLHHFTDPLWLAEKGGWENEETVVRFEKYVRKTVEALKEYVSYWCTINEPNGIFYWSYLSSIWPPGKKDFKTAMGVITNLVRAHAAAYHAIHSIQPAARVGFACYYRGLSPKNERSPLDRWAASLLSKVFNEIFPFSLATGVVSTPIGRTRLPQAKGTQDYFGLNYYTRDQVSFRPLDARNFFTQRTFRPGSLVSPTGFIANEPEGFYEAMKWALQFKIPIIITENGIEDAEDKIRPTYLIQHLHQVWRAVNFNFPIKGYLHWTLVDNFEWDRGWTQRFGLWELDPATQARRKRPSADLYAAICGENGISSDMVAQYASNLSNEMFPD